MQRLPLDNAPPVPVALFTMKALLDTMKVTASRVSLDRRRSGFEERRRTGVGHYLTPQIIARRHPFNVSDLFRNVPGLTLESAPGGTEKRVLTRTFRDAAPTSISRDIDHGGKRPPDTGRGSFHCRQPRRSLD